ncbi:MULTISPECIES: IS66-like element accessory protein TnpA [Methylorubrum]|uniref:IS66-like element accessory protein TnpA n=1 Tax=Methylorubrum TaxID=2282523 RepID=UPI00209F1904|nr:MULTISPECIES: transposase [Methylorubrum]MDF9861046.1 transposase [Methylorubrum pseudosasae]MDH6640120.1 transposase [Methylobacterium sp. SuP10 SLI 274]MDH6669297.1 transposase [Methylorubrum zatmanii]MCP1556689.1 transposase [Methylorubrum extorquens]MCY1640604.1 transposase [Methylorubrum sp. SL192]
MTSTPHIVVAGTRRTWSPERKRAILAEADDPATTASEVARRHGLHASLLFRWRRALRAGAPAPMAGSRPRFIPLGLPAPPSSVRDEPLHPGGIEIELAGDHRGRAEAGAEVALLQGVIAALLGR